MAPKSLSFRPVSVSDETTELAPENVNRTYLLIINDDDSPIYVVFGESAQMRRGMRLNAGGGSFESSDRNQNLDLRQVNCIHGVTGQTKNVLVIEG